MSRPTCRRWRRASARRSSGWGRSDERHRVATSTRCADDGPLSLAARRGGARHARAGLAIITEGLLGYLSGDAVDGDLAAVRHGCWPGSRAAATSRICTSAAIQTAQVRRSELLLSAFVRGRVHLHFDERARGGGGAARGRVRLGARSTARRSSRPRSGDPEASWCIYLRHQPGDLRHALHRSSAVRGRTRRARRCAVLEWRYGAQLRLAAGADRPDRDRRAVRGARLHPACAARSAS